MISLKAKFIFASMGAMVAVVVALNFFYDLPLMTEPDRTPAAQAASSREQKQDHAPIIVPVLID